MSFGEKAKLVDIMDTAMAENSKDLFTIEILLTKSPVKKVKCGAIAVYMLSKQSEALSWKEGADPLEKFHVEQEMNKLTDVMLRQPEMFKEDQGMWLNWALPRALEIFKELHTNAKIVVKSPKLKIKHVLTRDQVLKGQGNPRSLFKTAFDIDALLNNEFTWDPWSKQIRRGRIGADIK